MGKKANVQWLSPELQEELRGSLGGFLLAIFAIAFAVFIDWLEHKFAASGLHVWLTFGMQVIAMEVFYTDVYSITVFCVKVVVRSTKDARDAIRE